jgi:dTDP-glucose 4,6-dehydratase
LEFETGLAQTIDWYKANGPWVEHVRSGAYRDYYEQNYGARGPAGQ